MTEIQLSYSDRTGPDPLIYRTQSAKNWIPAAAGMGGFCCGLPDAAEAHTAIVPYTLPVPFWMYLFACGATMVLTFAALGVAATMAAPQPAAAGAIGTVALPGRRSSAGWRVPWPLIAILRVAALFCLALTIVAGLIGTADPAANIGMNLFWIGFLLAFTYATAVIGNLFQAINPWRVLIDWTEGLRPRLFAGRIAYPAWLAYWPAFLFYIGLIWLELLVLPRPATLAGVLIGYTVLTFAGSWLFGAAAWFRWCDVFSVFFRVVGLLAPVEYTAGADGRTLVASLRPPLAGVLRERPEHISLVLFILFMLSSTTYDGLKDTGLWQSLYWSNLLALLQPLWGSDMAKAQALLAPGYDLYQRGGLLISPFLYLGIYLLIMAGTKAATRSSLSIRRLALNFAFTVIPIAFVYNFAHYYTVLLTIWTPLPYILSDPFGYGWNLLGLTQWTEQPPLDMGMIWNTEVAVILAGHVASVYLAHLVAMRVFPSRRDAWRSEVPLLFLMVAYTFFGLFVLSLPLAIH